LERKVHQTRLEIDLGAITNNLKAYKSSLHAGTGIMVMVKAFSYGAGSYEVANLLQFHRVEYLAVAYVDEGVELRKAGIHLPIMVMNTEAQAFPELLEYNLEPEIYSIEIANLFHQYLLSEGIAYFPIHIKLDTGMHRLGFEEGNLQELINSLSKGHVFKVQSVFTHLVASEDPAEDGFTRSQVSAFDRSCALIQACLGYSFLRHAANTAAISRHPNLQYDLVRLGIGLYGVDPGNSMLELVESGTLRTTISQIKDVKAGESVGYGRKAILKKDSRIATIRIGYADGYPRNLGNGNGSVWINGQLVKTVGNVCMDMTMVDITEYPGIHLNDEVVIFGKENSIKKVAADAQTIAYEIMTGISQRVPRVYFGE
jgi:alanine racemase